MASNENLIPIPGRLHSVATEGHVSGADEIYDDTQQKDQETINSELIQAVGTGGSVDSRIAAAVNVEKTRAEGAEEALDGRIDTLEEAVGTGGSVDSRISSAVNAAKSEIKGNATTACDTLGEAEALISAEATRAQAAESNLNSGKANKATTLAGYGITDAYTKSETYTKEEVHNLITTPSQEYVSVTATDQTTAVTDVLPATGAADTTYRVGNWDGTQYNDSVFSEYAWNGSAYIKLSTKSQIGEVYDISANHADTKYADLAAALGTNGANVPQSLRKGGMSVKFVQSSDNNYVQYRLMSQTFSTTESDWQGVDVEPIIGSHNLVESGNVGKEVGYLKRTSENTKNLFDPTYLMSIAGWTEIEADVFSGTLLPLHTNFSANNKSYPVISGFKENTSYCISLEGMNTDSGVIGTGITISIVYTDNTSSNIASLPNSTTDWTSLLGVTAANKTVAAIRLSYGSNANHVWKLRNIQLEEGTAKTSFYPFIQAVDFSSREDIDALKLENTRKPEINISTLFPTGGIDGTNKYTLSGAIAKIPDVYKVPDITIGFFNSNNKPVKYRLVSNSFSTWEKIWFECGITYGKFGYSAGTLNINTVSNKIETKASEGCWYGYGYRVIKPSSVGVLSSNIYATSSSLAVIISNGSEMIPIDYDSPIADGYCVVAIIQTNYASDLTQKQFKSVIWCGSKVTVDGKNYLPNGDFLVSKVDDLESTVEEISKQVESISVIPEYFEENIQEAENAAINDIAFAGVNGENFIFITDMHWEQNARHSPALIKKITNDMCIGNIVFGGDAINGQADQDIARQYFNAISGGLSSGNSPFVAVFGNHDYNRNDGGVAFSNGDKTFYALFQKKNDYRIDNPTYETYFYFDNKAANVRHIILNYATLTNGSAQETWLTTLLNNTPNDMHIILYTHIYINTTSVYDGETWIGYNFRLEASAQVLNSILENTTKKVEAIIAGHLHLDNNGCTPSMIPVVLSDCDAISGSQALGTKNEQAFDIVTTDFGNKIITCRRIGRGKSRIIHYNTHTLSVNGTLDISALLSITPTSYSIRDNFNFQYRKTGGITYSSTLASINSVGLVTALSSGIAIAVAENDDCIETFNIKIE